MSKPGLFTGGATYEGQGVDQADIPVAAPAVDPTNEKRVNVVSTDGQIYGVPESQLALALKSGDRIASKEDVAIDDYLDENKGISGALKVAAKSFANEATFGATGALDDALDKDPLERAKEEALLKQNTIANWAGGAGGFALSMLYGGEIGETANLAGRAAEKLALSGVEHAAASAAEHGAVTAAEHLGITAAEHATAKAAAEKAAGLALGETLAAKVPAAEAAAARAMGPSLARKMFASGAGMAAESLVYSAPKAVTELALGDPERAAETLLFGAGAGMALGMGGALAKKIGSSASEGIGALLSKGAGAAEKSETSIAARLRDYADEQVISSTQALQKYTKKFAKIGKADVAEIIEKKGLTWDGGDAGEYFARVKDARNEAGAAIGDLYKGIDAIAGEQIDKAAFVAKLREQVEHPLLKGMDAIGGAPAAKAVDAFLFDVEKHASEKLTFEEAHKLVSKLGEQINWEDKTASKANEALTDLRFAMSDSISSRAEAIAQKEGAAFIAPLKAANKEYAVLSTLSQSAEKNISRQMSNRGHSLTDYIGNTIGGVIGSALGPVGTVAGGLVGGHVNSYLRNRAPELLSKGARGIADFLERKGSTAGILGVEQAMKSVAERLDAIPNILSEITGGKARSTFETMPSHLLSDFVGHAVQSSKKSQREKFDDLAGELADLSSDPQRMSRQVAELIQPYTEGAPGIAGAYAVKLTQALTYLQGVVPKAPAVTGPFQPPSTWKPSDAQMADFARRVHVVQDPFSVLQRLKDQSIAKADVETLKAVYPKIYESMVGKIMEAGATPGAKPLPYAYRLKLSMLTGAPIDRSIADVAKFQANFAAADADSVGASQPAQRPNVRASTQRIRPPSVQTETQRLTLK